MYSKRGLSFQRSQGCDGCFGRASKNELDHCAVVVFQNLPRDRYLAVCYLSLVQHDLSNRSADMTYSGFENWHLGRCLQSNGPVRRWSGWEAGLIPMSVLSWQRSWTEPAVQFRRLGSTRCRTPRTELGCGHNCYRTTPPWSPPGSALFLFKPGAIRSICWLGRGLWPLLARMRRPPRNCAWRWPRTSVIPSSRELKNSCASWPVLSGRTYGNAGSPCLVPAPRI